MKRIRVFESEKHYSEIFAEALVAAGWKAKGNDHFEKTFLGVTSVGGQLNPKGKAIAVVSIDSAGRWVDVDSGWYKAEFDGRDYFGVPDKFVKDIEDELHKLFKGEKSKFRFGVK